MQQLIDLIIDRNTEQAEAFKNEHDRRTAYRANRSTEISVMKCMDGRVHLPSMCGIPMGILKPYRNIGGVFNVAWPALQPVIATEVSLARERNKTNLFFGTYHFSKSDPNLGCAGHGYDTEKAIGAATNFVRGIQHLFADYTEQVQAVLMGIETDEDALVLFDGSDAKRKKKPVSVAELVGESDASILELVRTLNPAMPEAVVADVALLVSGNARHIADLRKKGREPEDKEHRERILGVGMGFDWLHERNLALIINDLDPALPEWIATAAKIIKGNLEAGRIPESGAALAVMVPYWDLGFHRKMAAERARYLMDLAQTVLKERHGKFAKFFTPIMGIIDQNTRQLELFK